MSDKYLPNIGALAADTAQRDAIHIAVAPVVAAERLYPGQRIAFEAGSTERVRAFGTSIGIVDPFLDEPVYPGQRCWMFLYPNTITSLRHEWTHPAFEQVVSPADEAMASAKAWLTDFANEFNLSLDGIIAAGHRWLDEGDYTRLSSDIPDRAYQDNADFWRNFRVVTGRHAQEGDDESSFFSCSC